MCLFELLLPILFILAHSAIDHSSLDGDVLNSVKFDEETIEKFGGSIEYEIGWKRVMFCNEGYYGGENIPFRYTGNGGESDSSEFEALAPYAITVKIVPDISDGLTEQEFDNYAIYGQVCKNEIIALNNLKELSYQLNVNTLAFTGNAIASNWFAKTETALNRIYQGCSNVIVSPLTETIYHGACRGNNIHIIAGDACAFDPGNIRTGKSIAIYFGFDKKRQNVCDGTGSGGLIILPCTINECDDGNMCNGVETCNVLTGQCDNGKDIVCKIGETCVPNTGDCITDCDVFNIDVYAQECSADIILRSDRRNREQSLIIGIFNIQDKDSLIIYLLIINLIVIIMFVIYCCYQQMKNQRKYQYQKVKTDIDINDKPENQL